MENINYKQIVLNKINKLVFILFLVGIPFLPLFNLYSEEIHDRALLRALKDEMQRSVTDLKLENQSPPYYLAYRIVDDTKIAIKASYGGLLFSDESRSRNLYIDLRVGNYQLDNSNFLCQTSGSRIIESDRIQLPVEDDYFALRQAIWLVTDGTYKRALEKLARKKAYLQNKQNSILTQMIGFTHA